MAALVVDDPFAVQSKLCAREGCPMEAAGKSMYCSQRCRDRASYERERGPGAYRVAAPIRMTEGRQRQLIEGVVADVPGFVRRYFGYEMLPFHKVLLSGLFQGGLREYLLPTEHAKTTYGAIVFPLASLVVSGGDARHIVGATNLREASQRVKQVKTVIELNSNGIVDDFPWLRRWKGKPWTVNEIWVEGASTSISNINASVTAIGRGARDIKGRRAKTVFDDLEGMNEALTQAERDRLWNWLTLEALRCLEDPEFFERPLVALLGTPYSVDSLYFRAQRAGFKVFRQPFRYANGDLIWPEKRAKIAVLKRALSTTPGAFEIAMKLDPKAADPDAMSYDEIRQKSQAEATRFDETVGHFRYNVLDPASGSSNKRVDYAGIAHVKIRWPRASQRMEGESLEDVELPWVEVYEPRAYKHGVISQVKLMQQIQHRFGGPIIFETNGPQATTYRRLFEAFANEVALIGFYTGTNKWDGRMGILVVREIAKAGRLKIFPREHPEEELEEDQDLAVEATDLLEDQAVVGGDIHDAGVRALLYEIRDLDDPKAHNHIVHGIWFAVRHSWEQRRRGVVDSNYANPPSSQFTDRTEELLRLAGHASYVPHTGYGGGRVIDLRRYKSGGAA
jgi:hypothetical protein